MTINKLSNGTFHKVPKDLKEAILKDAKVQEKWESLTPLARNEWICWCISVTLEATRKNHIQRLCKELKEGKRRPCCWIGCIHRTDKEVSASVKGILEKRKKK